MEGRTIVRPDQASSASASTAHPPSMEGRTIVRPDDHPCTGPDVLDATFNGGPDNRPARPRDSTSTDFSTSPLQWRAGQSSGQTRRSNGAATGSTTSFNGGPDNRPARRVWPQAQRPPVLLPSMEGRTIVRPDQSRSWLTPARTRSFNGGPDNRPARLDGDRDVDLPACVLQWRAGQSSGQTRTP